MSTATLIGLAAGALTTLSWLPQVLRAFRTRSTKDFAWSWFAMFGTGVTTWLVYGSSRRRRRSSPPTRSRSSSSPGSAG